LYCFSIIFVAAVVVVIGFLLDRENKKEMGKKE